MYVRVITHSVVCTRGTPPSYRLEYRCVHIIMCNNLLLITGVHTGTDTDAQIYRYTGTQIDRCVYSCVTDCDGVHK